MKQIAIAVMACMLAQGAHGAVVLGDTFDSDLDGWTKSGDGTQAQVGSLDGHSGVQQITANDTAIQGLFYEAAGDLAGNVDYASANIKSVTFDFYAGADDGGFGGGNDLPGGLLIYFVSGVGGGATWYYDLTSQVTAGWGGSYFGYGANFAPNSGWFTASPGHDQSTFLADLADVDQIGLELTFQGWNGQVYGIDDFELNNVWVPEPETYAMLGFALLSIAFTFRRQVESMLKLGRVDFA